MPEAAKALNPIGLLSLMASADVVALCPLVYGYVNYAAPSDPSAKPLAFTNAPRAAAGGRPGSTLGGTGIGISTRARITPAFLDHLRWLMGREAQTEFIPAHDGQPSRREAWHDERVNRRWSGFYEKTADTLEAAYVRPRHAGYIAFQGAASAIVREGLSGAMNSAAVVTEINLRYRASRKPGAER
jgi:multiple sugar transport system substrate-binding protein